MSEPRDPQRSEFQQLLLQLEQLERDQQALDLRDQRAVDEFQQRVESLKQRISRHREREASK